MKDWKGTEIEPGDTVLYVVTQSSTVTINEAVVIEIGMTTSDWSTPSEKAIVEWHSSSFDYGRTVGSKVTITQPRNLTVIKKASPNSESHPEWKACKG